MRICDFGTAGPRTRSFVLLAVPLAALLYLACQGGSEADRPSVTPQAVETDLPPPANASPGAQTTVQAPILDLASTEPLIVAYAAEEGDLRSDQPGLAAGDFNGDNIDDIVVGARFADGPDGRADAGAAYVILGSRDPPASIDLAAGEQDATIVGARAGDNLGFSVAAADINGDGIDDIVVGALFAGPLDQPPTQPGRAYILFGGSDLPPSTNLALGGADVILTGIASTGFFGDSIATGDVNGDGIADLLIGATFDSQPGVGSRVRGGAVHVFFGRRHWPAALSASESDIALYGAEDLDELGDFVASGDINGDGFDDILVTAEAADGPDNTRLTAGEVHVLFGGQNIKGRFEIARGQQDLSIYGAEPQDILGFSLAAGDLDGDGIDDLIMGARLGSGPGNAIGRAGEVFVLPGGHELPSSIDLAEPPDFVAAIHGQSQSDFLGSSVTIADLDGDGDNELIMGTGFADGPGRPDSGAIYLVEAPAGAGFTSVIGEILKAVVYGSTAGEHLGVNVLAADFSGDGRQELVAVAEGGAGPGDSRPGAGRVYVISAFR